jgi:GNAT superfamily N-acetyltransferase
MDIEEDDEVMLGAAPSIASTMFNRGLGFTEHPNRVPMAVDFFARHGVAGEVILDAGDAPAGIEPRIRLDVHVAAPGQVPPPLVAGLTVRRIDPGEADEWMSVVIAANELTPELAALWRSMTPHIPGTPGWFLIAAELEGRIAGAASLFVSNGVGWLSWASVPPPERGRGIQRALISGRARIAEQQGCDLVVAWALAGGHSSANLERAGFSRIGQRVAIRAADVA